MANQGYVSYNSLGGQLGRLSPIEINQTMLSPIQSLEYTDDKNMRKSVFTEDFYVRPVFGRPRLGISYAELEPYEDNIIIRMIITHIIDSVCSTDFKIVPAKEEEEVTDGMQSDIDAATDFFNAKKWMESWTNTLRRMLPDLLMYDCGVLIKIFGKECYDKEGILNENNETPPLEMSSRDGRSFLIDCDPYGRILRYWQYSFMNIQSTPIAFAKDEIIYIMGRPKSKSVYGVASLQIVRDVMDYLTASIAANRAFWENGMFPGMQIDHPDIVDPDELAARAQLYKETLKGEQNYNKALITSGGTKVTPLQFTNQQNQWLESSEYMQKLVFALYKISPSQLGFTEQTNRATAIVQSENYKQEGVKTILTLLENYLNREVIWKYFSEDILFKFDDSLDLADEKQQVDIDHIRLTDGTATINEIRSRDGAEEFADEECNAPFAQMTLQQKMMEESMGGGEFGGEEGEEEDDTFGGWGGDEGEQPEEKKTPGEKAEPETPAEKFEKAVTAGAAMGTPGAAAIPTVWDSATKKKKKKDEEDEEETAKTELDEWSAETRDKIVGELERMYNTEVAE